MARKEFKAGDRVRTLLGVSRIGTVLAYIPSEKEWSDGTYKYPDAIYRKQVAGILWDDGTKGWQHYCHITKVER